MIKNKSLDSGEIDISVLQKFDFNDNIKEYLIQMQVYNAGIKEVKTKLEVLDEEFKVKYDHNPIHHIESRLKSPKSILEKMQRRSLPLTLNSIKEDINDIAGIRVICNYLEDVDHVAALLLLQDDIKLKKAHDYISKPKANGYRSLHLVVEVPVFLAEEKKPVAVEVQIRTIAMDFWASLEHKLKYKNENEVSQELHGRLKRCAERISEIDSEMQQIYKEIESGGSAGSGGKK